MAVDIVYEKSALSQFLDELPTLLMQYKMQSSENALAHERAIELRTIDQVDPKYYEYNEDGSLNIKNSMGAQQESTKWQIKGASANLGHASSFAYGTEDVTTGAYTAEDYHRDKDAINELTLSDELGYNDALNIIDMGFFDVDGDSIMPGGQSREDIAEAMTQEGWWQGNKSEIRKRSDSYFQGVLMNKEYVDAEKYSTYKANEVAMRQTQLENIETQPAYITAQSTVNTLMDAEGLWQTKAGLRSVDDKGAVQYYNPKTGKEMDLDDFVKEFPATYQLMTASQPLEWMYQHYKDGGEDNPVIAAMLKENPSLAQNFITPLFDEMDVISQNRNTYEAQSIGLTDFSEPTAIPKDLDTALSAFKTYQDPDPTDHNDPNYDPNAGANLTP